MLSEYCPPKPLKKNRRGRRRYIFLLFGEVISQPRPLNKTVLDLGGFLIPGSQQNALCFIN
jgi:hypothetical protein